jgi:hypothetical protein
MWKKYFSTPDKSLMKPKPFDSLKNSIRPLRMTGSSLSFLGVDMTISSSFISSLGVFSAGGVEVIMPFSST